MTTAVTVYQFKAYPIRIHKDEQGDPWFFTEDMVKPLGLQHINMQVKRLLDDDEKDYLTICEGITGNPRRRIVSESGLYKLILRSTKPKAKAFQNWVTREVIPSIRKTGAYLTPDIDRSEKEFNMWNTLAVVVEDLRKEVAELRGERTLRAGPAPIVIPQYTLRQRFNRDIANLAAKFHIDKNVAYNTVYDKYDDHFGTDIQGSAKRYHVYTIEYAENKGLLLDLCLIAEKMLVGEMAVKI